MYASKKFTTPALGGEMEAVIPSVLSVCEPMRTEAVVNLYLHRENETRFRVRMTKAEALKLAADLTARANGTCHYHLANA